MSYEIAAGRGADDVRVGLLDRAFSRHDQRGQITGWRGPGLRRIFAGVPVQVCRPGICQVVFSAWPEVVHDRSIVT